MDLPSKIITLLLLTLYFLLLSAPLALAYGIKCSGDNMCGFPQRDFHPYQTHWSTELDDFISYIRDDTWIEPGALIACTHHVCAWVLPPSSCSEGEDEEQGKAEGEGECGSIQAREIKEMAAQIAFEHDCDRYGSVARGWPDGKEKKGIWKNGALKLGFVKKEKRKEGCGWDGDGGSDGICERWLGDTEEGYFWWKHFVFDEAREEDRKGERSSCGWW